MEKLIKNNGEYYQLIYDAENIRIEMGEKAKPERVNPRMGASYQALSINKGTGRISTLHAEISVTGDWQINKYDLIPVSYGRYVPGQGFNADRAWKRYSKKPTVELRIATHNGLVIEEDGHGAIKFQVSDKT
jgi:hypothetical protein